MPLTFVSISGGAVGSKYQLSRPHTSNIGPSVPGAEMTAAEASVTSASHNGGRATVRDVFPGGEKSIVGGGTASPNPEWANGPNLQVDICRVEGVVEAFEFEVLFGRLLGGSSELPGAMPGWLCEFSRLPSSSSVTKQRALTEKSIR
jgi:hypothetical protein